MEGGLSGAGHQELLDERDELGRNAAPAGGLAMSASDLARWLAIQLAHGKLPEGEGRLYSEAQAREMWTPLVIPPIRELPDPPHPTTPHSNHSPPRLPLTEFPTRKHAVYGKS